MAQEMIDMEMEQLLSCGDMPECKDSNKKASCKTDTPQPKISKFKYNGVCMDYCMNWDESVYLFCELHEAVKNNTLKASENMLVDTATGSFYVPTLMIKHIDQLKIAYDIATKPDMGLTKHFGKDEMSRMMHVVAEAMRNECMVPMSNSNKRIAKQSTNQTAKTRRVRKDIKPVTQG
jgi:hypothetical protein